jgi:hypothetical protein
MKLSKIPISQQVLSALKFVVPFLAWLFVFRDFVFGRIPVNMDTNTIYSVTKFYFNNLINGTVPLWDPFVLLGTPFYAITICSLFNPVTQLVPLLKGAGVNYYNAFIIYITAYYFLGAVGFYCLARTLFAARGPAYIGYILFLFSGIGASMFNQFTIVELFVPAVWFFLFLVRFCRNFRVSDFLGLSYSAMIVVISYLPFYFATLFGFFVLLTGALFFKETIEVLRGSWRFARRHAVVVMLCVLGIIVACAPLLVYKAIDSSKDVVSPGRHCAYTDIAGCYERTLNDEGGMSYKETSQSGGLAERVDWQGLFLHLDKISYGADQFFFVPLAAFLFILLAAFLRFDRVSVLLAGLGAVLALVGMADVTPLHRFLYEHVFFFKYFRNLFFFEAYIIPVIILFAVGQLKRLTEIAVEQFSNKKAIIFWTVVTHAGFFIYLWRHDGVILTSFLTLAASFILFTAFYLGILKKGTALFWAALTMIAFLQPFEVYRHYALNAQPFQCDLPRGHVVPEFSWTRPTEEVQNSCKIFKFVHYETFYDSMAMKDSRGVIGYPASVTRGGFTLSQWVDEDTLVRFTRHKLYLFDNVRVFDGGALDIRALGEVFAGPRNAAYVMESGAGPRAAFTSEDWGDRPPEALTGPSEKLKVLHFDVNRLTLAADLPQRKFLVYTDSFTKHWKVRVNGREEKLLRTDAAFKGIWLPQGQSTVEFYYSPPGGGHVYLIVTIVLLLFAGATLWSFWKEKNWPWMWGRP